MNGYKKRRWIGLFVGICITTLGHAGQRDNIDAGVDLSESRLVRVLTGRNESLRIQALAPLKRNVPARNAALDELLFALQKQSDQIASGRPLAHSTSELVRLIAAIDKPRAHQALIDGLSSRHMHVSMMCADALGRNRCTDSIESIKRLVERDEWKSHYGFRFNTIRALTLMGHPDAYEFLGQIRPRIDGQLHHELNQVFEKVTLDDFLGDEDRFDTWKNLAVREPVTSHTRKSNPDSIFKNASYSESAGRIKLQRQKYYGIDIEAKRLLFIIDHSGSMKKGTTSEGRWGSRLFHAKEALIKALEALPEDNEFGIIFYAEKVHQWKPDLVYATQANKQKARSFVYRLGFGGSTNTYGALRESMSFDDDLEAVFLLTDGAPSSGNIVHPDRIVADIVHRNRLRHLKINTIGIAVNSNTKNFLTSLAKQCSGEFREAD